MGGRSDNTSINPPQTIVFFSKYKCFSKVSILSLLNSNIALLLDRKAQTDK